MAHILTKAIGPLTHQKKQKRYHHTVPTNANPNPLNHSLLLTLSLIPFFIKEINWEVRGTLMRVEIFLFFDF